MSRHLCFEREAYANGVTSITSLSVDGVTGRGMRSKR